LADWQSAGLNKPSAFRAYLVTLPRNANWRVLGRPSPADWAEILGCLGKAMAS
jgi:hypothetical protein